MLNKFLAAAGDIAVVVFAETEQGIFEQVLHGTLDFESDPWPNVSDGAKDLLRKVLVRDPKKRLTAHEVLCELTTLLAIRHGCFLQH
jgi:serine/threonine protein kinase